MPRPLPVVVLAALLAVLSACTPNRAGKPPEATGTPVTMLRNFAAYEDAFTEDGLQWIRSQQELVATNSTLLRDLRVDWDKESVIVVALGTEPSGGYGVWISQVLLDKSKNLHVVASVREPAPGEPVTGAQTHPIAVAVIARTSNEGNAYLHTRTASLRP